MKPASVETLLGIAMGCIGMSMDDFCRCTPSEFYEAYGAWAEWEQNREKELWERARTVCLCSLQPYSEKQLRPQDVMIFSWEKEEDSGEAEEISHEEMMKRYHEAMRQRGMGVCTK